MGEIVDTYMEYISDFSQPRYVVNNPYSFRFLCEKFPTCEGCPFNKKHQGCLFRKGLSPREW